MTINELVEKVHETAKSKGWYDRERSPLEAHMLMVSEISEATEEARQDCPPIYAKKDGEVVALEKAPNSSLKPEGEAVELADAVIRIADYFGHRGWDLETVLQLKMKYNEGRPFRHGGKKY